MQPYLALPRVAELTLTYTRAWVEFSLRLSNSVLGTVPAASWIPLVALSLFPVRIRLKFTFGADFFATTTVNREA